MKLSKFICCLVVASCVFLTSCMSTGNNKDSGGLSFTTKAVLCTVGGAAGAYIGKELAEKYLSRTSKNYSAQTKDQMVKGFQVGLFLAFCGIANYAGETIYKRLSEDGLEKRREQVLQAAVNSESTTYTDPKNPSLRGNIEIVDRYTEDGGNTECVVAKDTLQDDQSSESIMVTQCRDLPNGQFRVTAV